MPGKRVTTSLRYVGDGTYIPGVPARNLTAEEAERYRTQIEDSRLATGVVLYVSDAPAGDAPAASTETTNG